MFNYYINERNANRDERDLATLKVEQEVIYRRQKLASNYKDKVFQFIDKCSRNPIVAQDEYWDRYKQERIHDIDAVSKSLNFKKGSFLEQSSIMSSLNPRSSITLQKDREINPKCSPLIDASPPSKDAQEAFYKQLRPRLKDSEVVGPLKLKIHSSLERVYDKLKERAVLDGGSTEAKNENCGGVFSEKQSLLTSKLARYTTIDANESRNNTGVSNDLSAYMRKRTQTHLLIKLNKTNAAEKSKSPRVQGDNINIVVLKPLRVDEQTKFLKKRIFPELHGEKRYFKAAQTLLISDQPEHSPCTYIAGNDDLRYEQRFGKVSKNPLAKALVMPLKDEGGNLDRNNKLYQSMEIRRRPRDEFEEAGLAEPAEDEPYDEVLPMTVGGKKPKVKLNQLAREMLIHCNVIRRKRQELQDDRVKALRDEYQRRSLASLK